LKDRTEKKVIPERYFCENHTLIAKFGEIWEAKKTDPIPPIGCGSIFWVY
jgi:hypothetical protein